MRRDCKEYERVEKQVVFKNNKNAELNEWPKYLNNAKKYKTALKMPVKTPVFLIKRFKKSNP
ncbi:hypothetical protein Kyoto101A_05850 [Helicobacter pylori]